jgi:hypothetical protein
MNNRKFQAECRRLMWRATRRDWWLSLAKFAARAGLEETAEVMADIAADGLKKDTQQFAALLRAKQDTDARTLRA